MVAHRAGAFDWKLAVVMSLSCAGIGVACSSSGDSPGGGGSAGAMTASTGGSSGVGGSSGASGSSGTGGSGGAIGGNGGSGASGSGGSGASGSGGSAGSGASGSGGSGGTAGMGGTLGGTDGGPAAEGGTVTGSACPSGAAFCSGFEDMLIPQGATYRPVGVGDPTKTMALDDMIFKYGKKSLRVNPASGYDWRMLSVPTPGPAFWVRLYMRSSIDIGQAEHNAFFQAMPGDGEWNTQGNLEVAEQYCEVVLNLDDDVVLPKGGTFMCGGSVMPLAKDEWHCMEAFFDGPNGAVQVYADGASIIDKTGWKKSVFKTFSFGMRNVHGPSRTMWYDDVAVASQRIGCEP